jgi:dUTP pyrophosphatase
MELKDSTLAEFYGTAAVQKTYSGDSGFDLYTPVTQTIPAHGTAAIDLGVVVAPLFDGGYYLFPRSSIVKTPLRLANSVGIIDNGYRGHLIAVMDNRSDAPYTVARGTRLVQICHPSLMPIRVEVCAEVSASTERGTGGFGSTG